MCFSAQASFIAAGLLSVIGFISLKIARSKEEALLASTPLIFAIQQSFEGILWLLLPVGSMVTFIPTYGYLFFAFIFWPVWVPFLVSRLEKDPWIKAALYATLAVGALVALFFIRSLVFYGAQAVLEQHHITYKLHEHIPFFMGVFLNIMYCLATVVPFFLARQPLLWLFGTLLSIAYAVSFIFYYHAFGSVWCFFAALLSSMILFILYARKKQTTR